MVVSSPPNTANDNRLNERTPLLKQHRLEQVSTSVDEEAQCPTSVNKPLIRDTPQNIGGVISILLLGVFIANADGSLLLATSGTISSEFNDLGNAGWLLISYTLAMCATQSLYGKLSDIYGRKSMIVSSYIFFTLGCALCGLGQTLPQVIVGRLIAGVGGAGINCLVSIVIAGTYSSLIAGYTSVKIDEDLVPIREVATWRSYVNIAATSGRSLGGPIGGYLTDTVGWRWSFLGQCPPTLLATALVSFRLSFPSQSPVKESHLTKLRRIDFLGAILFSTSIFCGLLVLTLAGQRIPWTSTTILFLFGASLVTGSLFMIVEAFWAKEPIFPLRLLLNWDVVTSYINLGFQSGAQMAMMMLVPMYFEVSAHTSVTVAGAHLMPSVCGNALGGILTGLIIRRTGRYKPIAIIGAVSSTIAYTLMLIRWHGHTSILESLYIIPGGFGNGIALSASFIALTAGIDPSQVAIASSGLYLANNVGLVAGLSVANTILQTGLRKQLRIALEGIDKREELIERSLTDLEFVKGLTGRVGEIVTQVYVNCLADTHMVSVIGAVIALIAALCIREHRL